VWVAIKAVHNCEASVQTCIVYVLNYQLFVDQSQLLLECQARLLFSRSATAVRDLLVLVTPVAVRNLLVLVTPVALGNVSLVLDTSKSVPLLQM
jgi:hypothetical protein